MKILIADDQKLVLLSLEKFLSDLGYKVKCADNMSDAIRFYDEFNPDLVISDINMPVLPNSNDSFKTLDYIKEVSGLEVVKYIKIIRKHTVPVMLLSGNNDDSIISKGFALGADDYMKKPISLNAINQRIEKLIGVKAINKAYTGRERLIDRKCVGVVIPFYNLEHKFFRRDYSKVIYNNLGYHLCFVNMNNNTNIDVLLKLKKGNEERISIYNCESNVGVSEAVRLGMLYLLKEKQFDFIGFVNPDLKINFRDFHDLVITISNSDFKLVSGVRPKENIKHDAKGILVKGIEQIIRKTIKMDFNDALCGVKLMSKDLIVPAFKRKFLTNESFDIEILMRMKKIYGNEETKKKWCVNNL